LNKPNERTNHIKISKSGNFEPKGWKGKDSKKKPFG